MALGSQNGTLTHTDPNTGAVTHRAGSAGPADAAGHRARHRRAVLRHRRRRKLAAVYRNLGTRLTKIKEKQQVTSAFAGGAIVLLLAGAGFGLARGGRLP